MTGGDVGLAGMASPVRLRFGRTERRVLLLAALGLWIMIYIELNVSWLTPAIDHQGERALRRIVTCAAGAGLCLAMVPALLRASLVPLGRRLWIATGVSLAAYMAHLGVRLAVFHLYRPLWGPLDVQVILDALAGDGWMFGLWAAVCLLVFAESRRRDDGRPGAAPSSPTPAVTAPEAVWCEKGGRRVRVALADVFLFAAERDYVRLHTREQQYLVRGRLKDWAYVLPEREFMQIHRSAIVRLSAIGSLERAGSVWRVRLPDGTDTLVSRPKSKDVRQRLADVEAADRPCRSD